MLTPEQVKPLLMHEDRDVRAQASSYFADSGTRDTEILSRSLEAILQYGHSTPGYSLIFNIQKLPADASAVPLFLRLLETSDHPSVLRDTNRAISRLPLPIWDAHQAQLSAAPNLEDGIQARVERRREFLTWTGERLFEELEAFSADNHELYGNEVDNEYLDDLLEALAKTAFPTPSSIQKMISHGVDRDEWLHSYLVKLAGLRRLHECVPILLECMEDEEGDVLLESVEEALGFIGDPWAADLIRTRFLKASFSFKLYATGILGKIHDKHVEETILDLLRWESDAEGREHLCMALADQFSMAGIREISKFLRETGPHNEGHFRVDLEESLLWLSIALNVDIPEQARLRRERDARDRRIEEFDKNEGRFDLKPRQLLDNDDATWEDDGDYQDPSEINEEALYPTDPIKAMTRPKPNDPCPCGSGKKYKKCCRS